MKIKLTAVLLSSLLLLNGCTTVRSTAAEYERLPLKITKNPTKEGRSCSTYSWFTKNDLSVESARSNGGITEIISIDKEVTTSLFHYKVCTVVRGN